MNNPSVSEDIHYFQADISGWSLKMKQRFNQLLEVVDVYQMSFGPCPEEEIDHYVAFRGTSARIDRVLKVMQYRYKAYLGQTWKYKEDDLVFPLNEGSTTTYKQFIDKWVTDNESREFSKNLNTLAREDREDV